MQYDWYYVVHEVYYSLVVEKGAIKQWNTFMQIGIYAKWFSMNLDLYVLQTGEGAITVQ